MVMIFLVTALTIISQGDRIRNDFVISFLKLICTMANQKPHLVSGGTHLLSGGGVF